MVAIGYGTLRGFLMKRALKIGFKVVAVVIFLTAFGFFCSWLGVEKPEVFKESVENVSVGGVLVWFFTGCLLFVVTFALLTILAFVLGFRMKCKKCGERVSYRDWYREPFIPDIHGGKTGGRTGGHPDLFDTACLHPDLHTWCASRS